MIHAGRNSIASWDEKGMLVVCTPRAFELGVPARRSLRFQEGIVIPTRRSGLVPTGGDSREATSRVEFNGGLDDSNM